MDDVINNILVALLYKTKFHAGFSIKFEVGG